MRILGVLVALLIVVAVIGYFRGWFQAESHDVNGHDTITVTVDKAKLNRGQSPRGARYTGFGTQAGKTFGGATAMRKLWQIIWCLTGVTSSCWVGGCAMGQAEFEVPQYPQYVQYPEGAPPVMPAVPGRKSRYRRPDGPVARAHRAVSGPALVPDFSRRHLSPGRACGRTMAGINAQSHRGGHRRAELG